MFRAPAPLVVGILFLINLLNYLDRWTVAAVLGKIESEFGISDSLAGLLTTVFIVTYMVASPLFGFLADRFQRTLILAVGVSIWSGATLWSSFATSYGQLLAARAIVGIGEASYATVSPTIIADLYPVAVRTRVLAVYYIAIPVGSALGYIVGGSVASAFDSWRAAFRVTPAAGLFLAWLQFLVIEEPERGKSDNIDGEKHRAGQKDAMRAFLHYIASVWRVPSFAWCTLGFVTVTFTTGALAQWAPLYMQRITCAVGSQHESTVVTLIFGGITLVTGVLGTVLGAYLSHVYGKRYGNADAAVCAVGMLIAAPMMGIALWMARVNILATWFAVFVGELAMCLNWAPVAAIQLYVVSPHLRGTAAGQMTLIAHLFGDALSPYAVGQLSDSLARSSGNFSCHNVSLPAGWTSGNATCPGSEPYLCGVALGNGLYMTVVAAGLGAVFFAVCALFVARDRDRVLSMAEREPLLGDAQDAPESDPGPPDYHAKSVNQTDVDYTLAHGDVK